MFDIGGPEFVVLCLVAVIVIGPERLPKYAEQLAGFIKMARGYVADAKSKVDKEIGGEDGAAVDWSKLDPRQYDPRRIIKDALLDNGSPQAAANGEAGQQSVSASAKAAWETASAAFAGLGTIIESAGTSATAGAATTASATSSSGVLHSPDASPDTSLLPNNPDTGALSGTNLPSGANAPSNGVSSDPLMPRSEPSGMEPIGSVPVVTGAAPGLTVPFDDEAT